jgi:lysophospholipase
MDEYLDDLDAFLDRVGLDGRPRFLLGHSMGGTIVTLSAVTRAPETHGIILSGPALTAGGAPRLMTRVLLLLGRFFPSIRLRQLDASTVSRDPAVTAAYDADPLVDRGKMHAGTLAAMLRAMRTIERHVPRLHWPLLVMHGTEDRLASPHGSRTLHERASSQDKTLRLYEGLYHEIFNEPEQDMVLAELAAWLDART